MKSAWRGRRTSGAEVTNVSTSGFWLLVDDRELFAPFEQFPWFREAPIGHVLNVQRPHPHHLYWPDLDVDVALESIEHPERYPLVSRLRPGIARKRTRSRSRSVRGRTARLTARR